MGLMNIFENQEHGFLLMKNYIEFFAIAFQNSFLLKC